MPPRLLTSLRHITLPLRSIHTTPQLLHNIPLDNIIAPPDPSARQPLTITKFTARGYHLSDNLVVSGGLLLIDGTPLLWDVDPPKLIKGGSVEDAWKGWDGERFKVLEMVVPRPEILLLGTGERPLPVPKRIREYISGLGIQLDIMDSRNAASTYNLLFEEGRPIGAALCPLHPLDPRTGKPR